MIQTLLFSTILTLQGFTHQGVNVRVDLRIPEKSCPPPGSYLIQTDIEFGSIDTTLYRLRRYHLEKGSPLSVTLRGTLSWDQIDEATLRQFAAGSPSIRVRARISPPRDPPVMERVEEVSPGNVRSEDLSGDVFWDEIRIEKTDENGFLILGASLRNPLSFELDCPTVSMTAFHDGAPYAVDKVTCVKGFLPGTNDVHLFTRIPGPSPTSFLKRILSAADRSSLRLEGTLTVTHDNGNVSIPFRVQGELSGGMKNLFSPGK